MLKAAYKKYILEFRLPVGTSRGVLQTKETWFVKVWNEETPTIYGIGECAVFRGLSFDDVSDYEANLKNCCENIHNNDFLKENLVNFPSIRFGIESAIADLNNGGQRILFPTSFTNFLEGIPINGLIWMGKIDFIKEQIREKLDAGYKCLKFKVGALNLADEYELLKNVRSEFSKDKLEIRLDANGSFPINSALEILNEFSKFNVHSIEQPIKPNNIAEMKRICAQSPIPIALDEELIGINSLEGKINLLTEIRPQYIIIKPALVGGFASSQEWIDTANKLNICWWITSALESNVGLNALAQWTKTLPTNMTQGLGTGSLFTNNIPSPLFIKNQQLHYNPEYTWNLSSIKFT